MNYGRTGFSGVDPENCLTLLLRPNPGIRSIVPEYSKAPATAIAETSTIPTYKGVFEVFPISRGI